MLTGKASEKLRVNPRRDWYRNLEAVTRNGDYEVTFHLKRPQPALLALLASGYSELGRSILAAGQPSSCRPTNRLGL